MYKLFMCLFVSAVYGNVSEVCDFDLVSREKWGARPAISTESMANPVPYVIIHHTYQPPACSSTEDCIKAMQWMQDLHQFQNKWSDIGYSFAVGGDGKVYVGRGWSTVGKHSPNYNNQSIGISLIGDWRTELPPPQQIETVHKLIRCGTETGKIKLDYKLFGHKQVRMGTECPGNRLLEEISSWNHFSTEPPFVWVRKKLQT